MPFVHLRSYLRQNADRLALYLILLASTVLYVKMFSFWAYRDELRHLAHVENISEPSDYIGIIPWIRPLELLVNLLNIRIVGIENTFVSHIISFSSFLISIVLVFHLAKYIKTRFTYYPVIAASLFAFHPVNVASIYRIDTISQQLVTLFSLSFLTWLLSHRCVSATKTVVAAVIFSTLIVLSKETSLGLIIAVPIAGCLLSRIADPPVNNNQHYDWRRILRLSSIAIAIICIYLLARHSYLINAMHESGGRYQISFSVSNIIKNVSLYLGSLFYLGNTLDVFDNLEIGKIFISSFFTLVICIFIILGFIAILKKRDPNNIVTILSLLILIFAGAFPASLIAKVNELYSYGSSPYFCLLISLLAHEGYFLIQRKTTNANRVVPVFFLLLLTWLGYSINSKLVYASVENDRTNIVYKKINYWARNYHAVDHLCIMKFVPFHDKSYNMFLSPDDISVQEIVGFITFTHHINLKLHINTQSDICRYDIMINE